MNHTPQRLGKIFVAILIVTLVFAGVCAGVLSVPSVRAASTLTAGDIALVGLNTVNPDELAFVLLTNVTAGTQITFTDNGWLAAGGFRGGEGAVTWTAATDLCAGVVISPGVGSMQFAADGDQVLAYQGAARINLMRGRDV